MSKAIGICNDCLLKKGISTENLEDKAVVSLDGKAHETIDKKFASKFVKCSDCGSAKSARFTFTLQEKSKKVSKSAKKTVSSTKEKVKKAVTKTVKKPTLAVDILSKDLAKAKKSIDKETYERIGLIIEWLNNEEQQIKENGRDYWIPGGVVYFNYEDGKEVVRFNDVVINSKDLFKILIDNL